MTRSIPTEDKISSLPDPIICHILSFLPTENSAATSILSKRWKPLWFSVSTLHFDDETFPNYDSFFKFVSSVFLSRDITLPLQSFNLICEKASSLHQHDINRFLQAAVQRGIENLNLEMTSKVSYQFKLPPIVFSCKTLVVIHLTGLLVHGISQVAVDFPLLKTLHLSFVTFAYDEYLLKLLSGCPILEELQIDSIHASNVDESFVLPKNFQCLPNLISANIFLLCGANVLFPLLCRANILCVDLVRILYDSPINV
jgi:hypothetical protein